MNEYLGGIKAEKKELVIVVIKRYKVKEKEKPIEKKESSKETEG